MRILIGIPTFDRRLDIDLFKGLIRAERTGKHHLDFTMPVSSHLSRNRNLCCHEALRGDYDALLFLDSDIGIQDEHFIDKLIETAYKFDAGIVGGAYRMKKADDELVYIAGNKLHNGKYENLKEKIDRPRLVDAVGTGIMLILREVLRKVSDPWFTMVDGPNLEIMPEDFEFCRKTQEAGFKIAVDPRFSTNHFGVKAWTHDAE